jgi:hypothetical protein
MSMIKPEGLSMWSVRRESREHFAPTSNNATIGEAVDSGSGDG